MLQQPFNPKNVDATDNQKEFWKKSVPVRRSTLALAILNSLGFVLILYSLAVLGRMMPSRFLQQGLYHISLWEIIIILSLIFYLAVAYFSFRAYGHLRRLQLPKKRMYIVIIIFMCISFLQRAFNQSFGLVELIFIALAIISLVNISTIKKMYSVEAIKTNIEK
ncbi:hypothetical protein [Listeria seeligeri]|uniref:hypothetical protein n=2 Tax=Listeria seeligeri TaxID=1640 RepID=UPI0010DFEB13|nr:hypothetical protein [Listeria seeligeri]MBC1479583.1 hypothetical protein [Listeria seeligeri]MBC1720355.1 hypothetical protein [Listeria seeligeri]MBC1731307.1 hypothetical protein [Listeria seeligeri]MBC1765090.1 hypothetical protein [Listeria seeligeri]MBC1791497.1 hypothetical protein [Listeria seeligeri]